MTSMLELDLIDDYLREQRDAEAALVAAPVRPEADPLLLPAEPRPSWKAFDPHFLNMTDLIDFPGPFNFEVSVADLQDQKRGKAYVYTPELRRLYSVSVEPVAFEVKVSSEVPPNCAMYVFAIYSDQRYRSENVVTCAYHRQTKDSDEQASDERIFLRAGNGLQVEYQSMGAPNRDVLVFHLPPSPGNQVIPLKFMCRNSCQGGINRRATKLVLVLCNSSNDTLGVAAIDFRIVTVPSRDCDRDVKRGKGIQPKVKVKPAKKPRSETDVASSDSEEYTIRIRGAKNFFMLKAAAEGLELRRKIRKEKKPKTQDTSTPDLVL